MIEEHLPILLVEDDEVDRGSIVRIFRKLAPEQPIETAADGALALERLRTDLAPPFQPRLILIDLNLPSLSGLDLLDLLKRDDVLHWIPAVVLTGSRSRGERDRAYDLGASGYYSKPADPGELGRRIEAIWSTCQPEELALG